MDRQSHGRCPVSRRTAAALLEQLATADLEGAACAGSGVEFIDPAPSDVDALVRAWCHRCVVVGRCRAIGDQLAPFKKHGAIYGARYYAADEPAEGWAVA